MNAEEFLKGLNEHDPVFEIDTEYEFTEEQLINFAERYHERKLKILRLQNVSQQRELLIKFLEFGRDRHYTPLTQCSIIDMVEDFELKQ